MAPHKLLIIHQGALGDVVAIFPVIIRLKRYFDGIDVLCQGQLGKLAKALGLTDNGFPLEGAWVASLFTDQPDQKVKSLLRPYAKVVLFSLSGELERSLNQITQNRCIRFAPKPPNDTPTHVTAYAVQNLVQCGLLSAQDLNENDLSMPTRWLEKRNLPTDRHKILIHPGSGSRRKRWPLSQFIQLEALFIASGFNTEFILGPAEEDLLTTLAKKDRKIHMPGDLLELAMRYKTAGGYIGNDSGASHLAAFMALPTVVIFGPADPRRWKPNGPFVEIVRPALECLPCFETEDANCSAPKCLDDLKPDTIVEAFYKVYQT
jgi:ADP-heptose:LPS heptosyltransferase